MHRMHQVDSCIEMDTHGKKDDESQLGIESTHSDAKQLSPRVASSHLMDPGLLLVILVWIPAVVIIRFSNNPIDGGLAHAPAATLRRGLRDDDLLRLADAVHGQGDRRYERLFQPHCWV